jgi:IS5 family transposase
MLKSLFIQQLYCLSDEQLERELADRISFRMFLGTTEIVPDSTTIWKFRERLAESGKDKDVWDEMQKQLDAMNLKVKKGIMQDASFITSDPGHAKMENGRRREPNPISVISFMVLWTKIAVLFDELRLRLLMFMIARWIWPMKAKFVMLIKDIPEPRQRDTMLP